MPKKAKGRLFENRIVVWDIEASRRLFKEGYYGKPLGIPKPKDFEFDAPLILDLMEGYFLMTKKVVDIEDHSGKELSLKQLHGICETSYTEFAEKFLVYKKLREAGYVVTPGIKFGSD
ncbi:MAG TPA: tRNA-intron lyase, partial [Nitrososphaerales archaeon]